MLSRLCKTSCKYWYPGLLFLFIQIANSLFESTRPWKKFSWAPHTVHIHYRISAYTSSATWGTDRIERTFRIPAEGWEHHGLGNLKAVLTSPTLSEEIKPDSVVVTYSVNGHPEKGETIRKADLIR